MAKATPGPLKIAKRKLARLVGDAEASAAAVNLHYVTPSTRGGITREKSGEKNFRYRKAGALIDDEQTLARIKALVLPPAWTDVWICPDPAGHLQATGIDARGRKQYRYHAAWTALRGHTKFFHLYEFGAALPALRAVLETDLKKPGLPRAKVLAAVVSVMEQTGIRVGNGAYEKLYGSYGLTTLKDNHVAFSGSDVRFRFVGKKGVAQDLPLHDRRLARIIRQCRDIPGAELFQYLDEAGAAHTIDSGVVNSYIKEAAGGPFTAKDFRTWAGTLHALRKFKEAGCSGTEAETKACVLATLDAVSEHLGNTRAVVKKYYIHPVVVDLFSSGKLEKFFSAKRSKRPAGAGYSKEELLLLDVLESAREAVSVDGI